MSLKEIRILFDDDQVHVIGTDPNGTHLCTTFGSWGELSDLFYSYEPIPVESFSDEEMDEVEAESRYLEFLYSKRVDEADYLSMASPW